MEEAPSLPGFQVPPIIVTGAAGFIGYHVARRLLTDGHDVVGLDNLNDYYDVTLKHARLALLEQEGAFSFERLDLADGDGLAAAIRNAAPQHVVHLGAQAGVRYSIEHPESYVQSNLVGFVNMLEACRHNDVQHLLFASSSSVYGANTAMPFSEHHGADHQVSLYGATKKSNEVLAHAYAKLYGLPCTGLRFFTVYGPWGRPDMALFLFTKAILAGKPIDVFNHGDMKRDFTYVGDVVEGVVRLLTHSPKGNPSWPNQAPDPATSTAPYRIYNIGNSSPVRLLDMISCLEQSLGIEAQKNMLPMQPGDVPETFADVSDLAQDIGYKPSTSLEEGVAQFVAWYRDYYGS